MSINFNERKIKVSQDEKTRRLLKAKLKPAEIRARADSNRKDMYAKLTDDQKAAYEDIPKNHRLTYLRAHTTKSMRAMIDATCAQCFGYEDLNNAIPECTSESCPIWAHRKRDK